MLNDSPNRNSSEPPAQQLTLRIPSASPLVMGVLQIVLVLFFAMRAFTGASDPAMTTLGLQGAAVFDKAQVYRLLTAETLLVMPSGSLWLVGLVQAILTLYTLYIVGNEMEKLWGNLRFALVYILGGAAGGLTSLLLTPTPLVSIETWMVTAIHAVLAVLGAQLVYMVKHRKLYGRRGRQRRNFLIGLGVLNLLAGALVVGVDFYGMIGGLIGGALLGIYISPYHLPRPHPDEPNALLGEDVNPLRRRMIPLISYVSILVAGVLLGITYLGN